MQQSNNTQLKLAWMPGMLQSPHHSLTLVVKGCFDLVADDKAVLSEDPDAAAIMGDIFVGDKPSASLFYANDLVIYKPKADLTLTGMAYPQPDQAGCRVSFGVGNWRKSLAVFNDRFWRGGSASAPAPFSTEKAAMPLTYENAYGGSQFGANPVGKGQDKITTGSGERIQPLPNIEHIGHFLSSPSQQTQPAGFGPLKDNWGDKPPIKGTYGDKWLKENFPYFPADFDWGYFNTAPMDQQVPYLAGDESLYFENLRPDLPQFNGRLPAIRPRLFLQGEHEAQSFFQEVTLRLDSLHVDMEAQQVSLVWRGVVGVQSDEFEEVSHACLYTEDMAKEKQPQAVYLDAFETSQVAQDTEHNLEPFEDKQGTDLAIAEVKVETPEVLETAKLAKATEPEADLDKLFIEQFGNLKKQMREANMPTDLVDAVGPDMDPQSFLDKIAAIYNLDLSQGEALLAKGQQDLKDLFAAQGHDPAELDFSIPAIKLDDAQQATADGSTTPDSAEITPPSGPSEKDMANGDLSGADLSYRDLSNRDFSEADLAGANLTGANISGSNFTSADLSGANLSEVNAKGAIFDHAILTNIEASKASFIEVSAVEALFQQAKLIKADFSLADISGADFSQSVLAGALFSQTLMPDSLFENADLSHCEFEKVTAIGANFHQSNLREVFCNNSNLQQTNFGGARLSLARIECSDLTEATLESVDAKGVQFIESVLNQTRAGEGSDFSGAEFKGGSAIGVIFTECNLSQAVFTNILLERADFSQANLSQSIFKYCDMKTADLTKADLTDTCLRGVNLFQAIFAKAKLTRSDLSLSNLYGAEFHQAILLNTNLKGANIKQTKIELGMVKQHV